MYHYLLCFGGHVYEGPHIGTRVKRVGGNFVFFLLSWSDLVLFLCLVEWTSMDLNQKIMGIRNP